MDEPPMIDPSLSRLACQGAVGLLAGAVAGLGYFAALWWNVGLFTRGGAWRGVLAQLARFAALAFVFVALAKFSAFALLAGALGLLISRRVLLRRFGEVE